ncbi:MAG: tripartite tricarboxylate transporter TctB family protein [Sphingomonadaceae bacterium]
MVRTMRAADIAAGGFLTALGIVALMASFQIAGTAGERLHPRTLPIILSWMILAGGIALFVNGLRYRGEEKPIDWPSAKGRRRVLISILFIIVYMALLDPLGFPLATMMFITLLTRFLGRYRVWAAALCGLASGLVVLLLFIDLLGLSFPLGPLELLF